MKTRVTTRTTTTTGLKAKALEEITIPITFRTEAIPVQVLISDLEEITVQAPDMAAVLLTDALQVRRAATMALPRVMVHHPATDHLRAMAHQTITEEQAAHVTAATTTAVAATAGTALVIR